MPLAEPVDAPVHCGRRQRARRQTWPSGQASQAHRGANAHAEKIKANEARIRLLQERWPACFALYGLRRKPLKVGIFDDLLAAGIMTAEELGATLAFYTRGDAYLQNLRAGAPRIDLDGNTVGEVTAEQAASARVQLEARRARKAAEKVAKQMVAVTPVTVGKRPVLKLPNRTVH